MKLIRTIVVFVLGMSAGYAMKSWDVKLPAEFAKYAEQIDEMRNNKEQLESEIARLRQLVKEN